VVCESRFLRIVPKGVPPLCAPHLIAWEGGGLPEVRQWIEDGDLVPHPWLGMVWLAQAVLGDTKPEPGDTKLDTKLDTKPGITVTEYRTDTKLDTKPGRPRKHGTDAEKSRVYRAKVKASRKAKRER
jgi:hypothetical protein